MVNTQGGYWGLAVADHDNDRIILTKKYYSMGQFSRYIRPGMTMLKSSNNCVAAFDEKGGRLVIVATNDGSSDKQLTFDLSGFSALGNTAQTIRTSNSENWKDVGNANVSGGALQANLAKQSVTTFIIDGVKGGIDLTDKIDLSAATLSGSDSWHSDSSTNYAKVFDGNTATYFDGVSNGWVQADLGELYDITAFGYAPRSGYEYRMTDGRFMVSQDGQTWTDLYTVQGKPSSGMHYITSLPENTTIRYIRYEVPSGQPQNEYNKDSSYCANIAEIELFGVPHGQGTRPAYDKLTAKEVTGTRSWHDSTATSADKAYDGDLNTYFDGLQSGNVTLDLGTVCDIETISYCPRRDYETRMIGGYFAVSTDGANWTKVYTVEDKPSFRMNYTPNLEGVKARYVRYEVPEGAPTNPLNKDAEYLCNIAEIAVYGFEGTTVTIGDVNSDGFVTAADIVSLQRYLLKNESLASPENSDINGDGEIDVFDMIPLRKLVLSKIQTI